MTKAGRPKILQERTRMAFTINESVWQQYIKHFKSDMLTPHFRDILTNWVKQDVSKVNKTTVHFIQGEFVPHNVNMVVPKNVFDYIENIYKKFGYSSKVDLIRNILSQWINDKAS
jgi:hypothetical protein